MYQGKLALVLSMWKSTNLFHQERRPFLSANMVRDKTKCEFPLLAKVVRKCIEHAERRLLSLSSSRYNISKDEDNVEMLEFNTAIYWNHVGVSWEDTFRVEPWEFVEHRLSEKYLFGEHSLICLAFEVQLFWNVVRYFKLYKNPDQKVSKASEWYKARKYSSINHRKVRHFETELQELFKQHEVQLKGETMPPLVVMLMQNVFLNSTEHGPFDELVVEEKNKNAIDAIAASGWHPLHIAAIKNEVEIADTLLKMDRLCIHSIALDTPHCIMRVYIIM